MKPVVPILIGAAIGFCVYGGDVSAKSRVLSGKMAWWQQMVGAWVCGVEIKPDAGQQPEKGYMYAVGSVAPDNVFKWYIVASGIEGDQYDGYSDTKKAWWETQSDSSGDAIVFRSDDGRTYDQISWPSGLEDANGKYREIYSLSPEGRFDETAEKLIGGVWRIDSLQSCERIGSQNSPAQTPAPRCTGVNCGR